MSLNLSDLTARLSERIGESQTYSKSVIKHFIAILEEAALENQEVRIKNFGSFKIKQRAARTGQNPRTREPLSIPACKVLAFSPSPALKQAMSEDMTTSSMNEVSI